MGAPTTDVLIVGAGPVGLTMAAALVMHGVRCRIVDKAPAPSDKSKALAVWCRTMELLDGLGLADAFVAAGVKLTGGSIHAEGQRIVHLKLTSDESRFGFPLMLPQSRTERLLTEHLARAGVVVERPVELIAFAQPEAQPEAQHEAQHKGQHDALVACTLRHPGGRDEQLEVPWLIGCDGAHSAVRHGLGMEFEGRPEPNDWMLADVHIDGSLPAHEVSAFWQPDGVLAFFPMGHGRFRVIADLGEARASARPAPTLPEVQATVGARGPGRLVLSEPAWLASFRINERKVKDYRRGRVMLAGDAAHIHSPVGGQGMNTGMQDAFNLAWKLALAARGQGRVDPLLDSYSIERSAIGDQVLRNAGRFTTMATLRHPAAQWLRNHVASIASAFDTVQERIRNEWLELSINYRHSPLSAQRWPLLSGGPAAGDRLPDAALLDAGTGRATTVLEALRGTRHPLLLLPADGGPDAVAALLEVAAEAERAYPGVVAPQLVLKPGHPSADRPTSSAPTWRDPDGRLHRLLHADAPTLHLVRPDGYIAFRSQPPHAEALLAHMERWLVRR